MKETVQIFGMGYIGVPSAAVLTQAGFSVYGVDVSERAVNAINAGTIHIVEEGLEEVIAAAVKAGLLSAGFEPKSADVHIIAVPTPVNPDKSPGLEYVRSASASIAKVLKKGDLVILESTVPPRTCVDVVATVIAEATGLSHLEDYHLAHCPERVIPGRILHELVHNDRIIGGTTPAATQRTIGLYKQFVQGKLLDTDATTAEMCKLMENTFRDVNIALANELADICETVGIDAKTAFGFANHHPRVNIHQPGIGVGGHCIPVDPWFIIHAAPSQSPLLQAARKINDHRPHQVSSRILQHHAGSVAPLVLLGLAYKPEVDDFRESPAVEVAELAAQGHQGPIWIVDPYLEGHALPSSLQQGHISIKPLEELGNLPQGATVALLVEHQAFASYAQPSWLRVSNGFIQQSGR